MRTSGNGHEQARSDRMIDQQPSLMPVQATEQPVARQRFFRGWMTVCAVHLLLALTFGVAYTFTTYFKAVQAEFASSRGDVSLIFSLAAFLYYLLGAGSGALADRVPARYLIIFGLLALSAGLLGVSYAGNIDQIYIIYAIGIGFGIGFSYIPAIGCVTSWFQRQRSRATGIAMAGLGIGTLLLPKLATELLTIMSWRDALRLYALGVLLLGLPAAFLVRRARGPAELLPEDQPDAATPAPGFATTARATGSAMTLRAAWKTAPFQRFYLVILFGSVAVFIPYVHLVPSALDLGISPLTAGWLIGLIGIGNIIGRFILAGLGDRLGRRAALALLTVMMACSLPLWALAQGFGLLALFSVTFGMSYGGTVALLPALAADIFGARYIGAILGTLFTAVGIAALAGPPLAGYLYDKTDSYLASILLSIGCTLISAGLIPFLTPAAANPQTSDPGPAIRQSLRP